MWNHYHATWHYLVIGGGSRYLWPLLYGLVLLAWLLSMCGLILLAVRARHLALRRKERMQPMLAIAPHTTARTVTQEISRYVILAMIVGPASMAYGVHWEYQRAQSKRHHYVDVLIQARQDDRNFLLKPIGMEPWPATSCTPLDWKPGQRMKWIDYQQRDGCKDFKENGSYVCYFDDLGKCIIFQEELAHVEYISQ